MRKAAFHSSIRNGSLNNVDIKIKSNYPIKGIDKAWKGRTA